MDYSGESSITLRSPDDDERDILIHKNTEQETKIIPKKQTITTKEVPREIISTIENIPTGIIYNNIPVGIPPVRNISEKKIISQPPKTNINPNINEIVKVSTLESREKNINPLYIFLFLFLSASIGGIQWFLQRKQK